MKIIAVNISQTISTQTILDATKRAWVLVLSKCAEYDYVISVSKGVIEGFLKKTAEHPDSFQPDRVDFDLLPCTPQQIQQIKDYINVNKINLKFISTKYID
ncbi:MAG: hypothetical protein H7239_06360 [Flavobacterium sp.]|nr:hypothetical protein [Flavobacterium sp.]